MNRRCRRCRTVAVNFRSVYGSGGARLRERPRMLPNERTTRSEVVTLPGEVEALIAAPERTLARPLVDFLKGEGINVQLVTNADSAFEEALLHRPSVVFIDDRIPPAGGIELCQRLKGNTRT